MVRFMSSYDLGQGLGDMTTAILAVLLLLECVNKYFKEEKKI